MIPLQSVVQLHQYRSSSLRYPGREGGGSAGGLALGVLCLRGERCWFREAGMVVAAGEGT
jgi:hypothetical protein